MGSSGSKPSTPSVNDVEQNLRNQLVQNARQLLHNDFGITNDSSELKDLLKNAATAQFKRAFGYDFQSEGHMKPPKLHDGREVKGFTDMCTIKTSDSTEIGGYLSKKVFGQLDLPKWMERNAIDEFSHITNTIVSRDTQKEWKMMDYRRTHDAKEEKQDNWKCETAFVYVYGALSQDGVDAHLAFIYYVGVYYPVISDTQASRIRIQKSAYEDAGTLTGKPAPPHDEDLKKLLNEYCENQFNNTFQFQYSQAPPDVVSVTTIKRNNQICTVHDARVDTLKEFIKNQIYDGVDILPSVKTKAIDETFELYKSVLDNNSTRSWIALPLDKSYPSSSPTINTVCQKGVVISWYNTETTDEKVKVSIKYIHILMMFYERKRSEDIATQELFKVLSNQLRQHIIGTTSPLSDLLALEDFMFTYAKQEFTKCFGFDWNGNQSAPPDKKSSGKVRSFRKLLKFDFHPIIEKEVKNWVDQEMFLRNGNTFPSHAMGPIYDEICKRMMWCSSEAAGNQNMWSKSHKDNLYLELDETSTQYMDIKHYAFYLYTLGDMTLNLPVGDKQSVNVKRLFVYYLGVFSSHDRAKEIWSMSLDTSEAASEYTSTLC